MTTLPEARQKARPPLGMLSLTISSCLYHLDAIHTKTGEYPTALGWDFYEKCLEQISETRQRHPTLPSTPSLPTTITPSAALAMIRDWCEAPVIGKGVAPASSGAVQSEDDAYKPAEWFTQTTNIRPSRLRQAARPERKQKQVRVRHIDGRPHYHVGDAKRWWESDMHEPNRP